MLWFNHTIWFTIHNLDGLFLAKGHLCSKYVAFLCWFKIITNKVAKASISFIHIHSMMIKGSLKYTMVPKGKLLAKCGEGHGACKIERMICPIQSILVLVICLICRSNKLSLILTKIIPINLWNAHLAGVMVEDSPLNGTPHLAKCGAVGLCSLTNTILVQIMT